MKNILITGANGFIGSFLVEAALKNGYNVIAGIRSSSKLGYLKDLKITYLVMDLSDKAALSKALSDQIAKSGRFDYIIHNAGTTKTLRKQDFNTINYQYTKNLINVLTDCKCVPDKFIYMSSLAAYGPGNEVTMQAILETDRPNPATLYGKSKLKTEQFIASIKDFPYLIFRPTGVYGPREKDYFVFYKMINRHIETYIGTSEQRLTFVYVKDLANVIMKSLESEISRRSYFVTDGNHYSSREFSHIIKSILHKKTVRLVLPKTLVGTLAFVLEKLAMLTGKPPTLNSDKVKEISRKNFLCDSSPLFQDFDFVPKYNLFSGLQETLGWYKKEKLL
jgi:nucleoside-diphosphate-sugar epimerase